MSHILLVDGDDETLIAWSSILRLAGYHVELARTGRAALEAAGRTPKVAILDLKLPDMSGLDVLKHLQRTRPAPACVVATSVGTYEIAVQAVRLGACDLAAKPLTASELTELIRRALQRREGALGGPLEHLQPAAAHASDRWAIVVLRALSLREDPRTLGEWSRGAAVSVGTLRNWCRTAGLPARHSLLFARVLRAVYRSEGPDHSPEHLLDVVDRRTLSKLLALSGGRDGRLPRTLEEFLARQQFVRNSAALADIRAKLSNVVSDPKVTSTATVRTG